MGREVGIWDLTLIGGRGWERKEEDGEVGEREDFPHVKAQVIAHQSHRGRCQKGNEIICQAGILIDFDLE